MAKCKNKPVGGVQKSDCKSSTGSSAGSDGKNKRNALSSDVDTAAKASPSSEDRYADYVYEATEWGRCVFTTSMADQKETQERAATMKSSVRVPIASLLFDSEFLAKKFLLQEVLRDEDRLLEKTEPVGGACVLLEQAIWRPSPGGEMKADDTPTQIVCDEAEFNSFFTEKFPKYAASCREDDREKLFTKLIQALQPCDSDASKSSNTKPRPSRLAIFLRTALLEGVKGGTYYTQDKEEMQSYILDCFRYCFTYEKLRDDIYQILFNLSVNPKKLVEDSGESELAATVRQKFYDAVYCAGEDEEENRDCQATVASLLREAVSEWLLGGEDDGDDTATTRHPGPLQFSFEKELEASPVVRGDAGVKDDASSLDGFDVNKMADVDGDDESLDSDAFGSDCLDDDGTSKEKLPGPVDEHTQTQQSSRAEEIAFLLAEVFPKHYLFREQLLQPPHEKLLQFSMREIFYGKHASVCDIFDPFSEEAVLDKKFKASASGATANASASSGAGGCAGAQERETSSKGGAEQEVAGKAAPAATAAAEQGDGHAVVPVGGTTPDYTITSPSDEKLLAKLQTLVTGKDLAAVAATLQEVITAAAKKIPATEQNSEHYDASVTLLEAAFKTGKVLYGPSTNAAPKGVKKAFNRVLNEIPKLVKNQKQARENLIVLQKNTCHGEANDSEGDDDDDMASGSDPEDLPASPSEKPTASGAALTLDERRALAAFVLGNVLHLAVGEKGAPSRNEKIKRGLLKDKIVEKFPELSAKAAFLLMDDAQQHGWLKLEKRELRVLDGISSCGDKQVQDLTALPSDQLPALEIAAVEKQNRRKARRDKRMSAKASKTGGKGGGGVRK